MYRPVFCFLFLCVGSDLSHLTYSIDFHSACEVTREPGITRIPLDGHIRGPLLQELEDHLRMHNPGLELKVTEEYKGWYYGSGRGADDKTDSGWKVTLHIRGPLSITLQCPPYQGTWDLNQMRERWHRCMIDHHDDNSVYWPFDPLPEDGDQPPLYQPGTWGKVRLTKHGEKDLG